MRVARDQTELDVVGVEQRCLAAVRVERHLVGDAGVVERARPEARGLRAKARLEDRLELAPVLGAARPRSRSVRRRRSRRRRATVHSAAELVVGDRGDADPVVVLGAVEAVRRGDAHELLVEVRAGRGDAADEVRVGGEDRAAVEQRRPHLLALAGALAVVQRAEHGDDRQHRVRRVAHPEAVVERRVAFVHRGRLVLEPGRRLVQRVETAEAGERTFEAVRPRVAVDDVGLHLLGTRRSRCRAWSRRPRSCCGARRRRSPIELERDREAAGVFDVERDVALAALAAEERLASPCACRRR